MITNEKQYRSTKASIEKLAGAFAALEAPTGDFPEVFAKAQRSALRSQIDELEERIADLADQEALAAIRPDLDGQQIMDLLGIGPGPVVGQAYRFLLERRLELGPQSTEEAADALRAWWAERDA